VAAALAQLFFGGRRRLATAPVPCLLVIIPVSGRLPLSFLPPLPPPVYSPPLPPTSSRAVAESAIVKSIPGDDQIHFCVVRALRIFGAAQQHARTPTASLVVLLAGFSRCEKAPASLDSSPVIRPQHQHCSGAPLPTASPERHNAKKPCPAAHSLSNQGCEFVPVSLPLPRLPFREGWPRRTRRQPGLPAKIQPAISHARTVVLVPLPNIWPVTTPSLARHPSPRLAKIKNGSRSSDRRPQRRRPAFNLVASESTEDQPGPLPTDDLGARTSTPLWIRARHPLAGIDGSNSALLKNATADILDQLGSALSSFREPNLSFQHRSALDACSWRPLHLLDLCTPASPRVDPTEQTFKDRFRSWNILRDIKPPNLEPPLNSSQGVHNPLWINPVNKSRISPTKSSTTSRLFSLGKASQQLVDPSTC